MLVLNGAMMVSSVLMMMIVFLLKQIVFQRLCGLAGRFSQSVERDHSIVGIECPSHPEVNPGSHSQWSTQG